MTQMTRKQQDAKSELVFDPAVSGTSVSSAFKTIDLKCQHNSPRDDYDASTNICQSRRTVVAARTA